MCGRYAADADTAELVSVFEIDEVDPSGAQAARPRFNIAPSTDVAAVLERVEAGSRVRKLVGLRWGLVPSWSKDGSRSAGMINARSETITSKPSFRSAIKKRRCIIPALGYYEWQPAARGTKQPWFVSPADGSIFAMAGIYELWHGPQGWLATMAIITTAAPKKMAWLHHRIPMQVLDIDAWLDPENDDAQAAMTQVAAPHELRTIRVDPAVGNVANQGPELVQEIELGSGK